MACSPARPPMADLKIGNFVEVLHRDAWIKARVLDMFIAEGVILAGWFDRHYIWQSEVFTLSRVMYCDDCFRSAHPSRLCPEHLRMVQ